jgi:Ser-tRNA(Ala) deacylase AlaX
MEHFLFETFPDLAAQGCKGSSVDDRRDASTYASSEPLPAEKVLEVQRKVNEFIAGNFPIEVSDDAEKPGYRWWKCGDIRMGCGGTHPRNTNEIGSIRIECEKSGKGKIKVITTLA